MLDLLFFAALREQLQCATLKWPIPQRNDPPFTVRTLITQLQQQSPLWQQVLNDHQLLCAVNQQLVSFDQQLHSGDEVALFPPVTGG